MEADFLATGNVFKKSFITASVHSVWVNFKPCAFIQMFLFCCWKALLKLGVNQFSSIFWVPNSGSRIFIKSFITTSVYRFSVNFKPCAFIQMYFFAAGKHYWNQVLISFLLFFQFLTVEAFFWRVETEFLSNTSSRLLYTDFGLISNRVLLFRCILFPTGKH